MPPRERRKDGLAGLAGYAAEGVADRRCAASNRNAEVPQPADPTNSSTSCVAGSNNDQLDGPGIGGEIVQERAAHGNRADVEPGIARGPLVQTTTQLCA